MSILYFYIYRKWDLKLVQTLVTLRIFCLSAVHIYIGKLRILTLSFSADVCTPSTKTRDKRWTNHQTRHKRHDVTSICALGLHWFELTVIASASPRTSPLGKRDSRKKRRRLYAYDYTSKEKQPKGNCARRIET
ncbi:hypothetical protein OUZ56_021530 [Daphnia magna]|uniref:Uncharacterized protein n=1 Tax=Daphnia magna TaxID=35525 RepID=A0ABQ9ZHN8_9CRUS|nr:hypothetical protein OUZ56_021530 [Daphnia magna]